MGKEFTHLTDSGVHMVEVGQKPDQKRLAIASGKIHLDENTIKMIQNEEIKKGNVLTTAQIAGIQAVKGTSSIIPLCHPLSLTGIEIDFDVKSTEIKKSPLLLFISFLKSFKLISLIPISFPFVKVSVNMFHNLHKSPHQAFHFLPLLSVHL